MRKCIRCGNFMLKNTRNDTNVPVRLWICTCGVLLVSPILLIPLKQAMRAS